MFHSDVFHHVSPCFSWRAWGPPPWGPPLGRRWISCRPATSPQGVSPGMRPPRENLPWWPPWRDKNHRIFDDFWGFLGMFDVFFRFLGMFMMSRYVQWYVQICPATSKHHVDIMNLPGFDIILRKVHIIGPHSTLGLGMTWVCLVLARSASFLLCGSWSGSAKAGARDGISQINISWNGQKTYPLVN